MANIEYKSLSSLIPLELKYEFYKNEKLKIDTVEYQEGYSFYEIPGLKNFQDIAINKNSCFILTSAVNLSDVFELPSSLPVYEQPLTILLQPRNSSIYYFNENVNNNTINLTLTGFSNFFIRPLSNTKEVELFVNNKYVQIDEEYPHTVRLNEKSLDPESIQRQRFKIVYENDLVAIIAKTNFGERYLAFGSDNVLRAVGIILNDTIINDYYFKFIPVTSVLKNTGFEPTNNWVSYYLDIESKEKNRTLEINKNVKDVNTNFLIDFTLEPTIKNKKASVNIANLKTQITPTGGPAPLDNTYTKNYITKN